MVRDRGTAVRAGWCGAALLLACSSAAPQSVASPLPPAAGPCRVDAPETSFEEVEVSLPGARFTLGLEDVPLQIELTEDEGIAALHVQSPLVFSATLPRRLLKLRVAVATDFYGGRLHLAAGQDPSWLGARGDNLLLSLEQSLGLVLDEPLALPCSRVTLREPMQPWETPAVLVNATPIEPDAVETHTSSG